VKLKINSTEAMKRFGAQVGALLQGGEYLDLIGDVGAGKTTFAKGLARGMGITETVQSPTFTISRVYETSDTRRLVHYDFYRLSDPGIMADELAESADDPQAIIVIEWGDIVTDVRPEDRLELDFTSPSETDREITLTAYGSRSKRLLKELAS
jgi:tRNA threonylcarbamoyladenosine biosynthesis protein TsaE